MAETYEGRVTGESRQKAAQDLAQSARERQSEQAQLRAAVALARDQVRAAPDEDVVKYGDLFPEWQPGVAYAAGDVVRFGDTLFRVAQAHTSQADWAPDRAITLFTVVQPEPKDGAVLQWMAGEIVAAGDLRTYVGVTWRCRQAHTTLAGWEPPNTPSLWEAV